MSAPVVFTLDLLEFVMSYQPVEISAGDGTSARAQSAPERALPAVSPEARRWAELWKELEFSRGKLLGQASHVRADRHGPLLELIPQLFDLGGGRRFIAIGMKYDIGPGKRRETGSVGMGQFVNLAISDWEIAAQLWELLKVGDLGVSFRDLNVINGNFDRVTKAADQYERDRWIQRVWELRKRLERNAKEHTLDAMERIAAEIARHRDGESALVGGGIEISASILEPDPSKEAMTRFRINQGMYGDHRFFVDRPVEGVMRVHGISASRMFRRASDLQRDLSEHWLDHLGRTLDDLIDITDEKEGAALARVVESAKVTRSLNSIVGTFWSMWKDPRFSAHADFEVICDHDRRADKYMDIIIQRALRSLLKSAVEEIGVYPYDRVNRHNFRKKAHDLKEALGRTRDILQMYARVTSIRGFNGVRREKDRLIREFQSEVLGRHGASTRGMSARA